MMSRLSAEELIALPIGGFVQELVNEGMFGSEQDVKMYLLERIVKEQQDPQTELPIVYYTEDQQIPTGVEYIQAPGDQLTDEFIDRAKKDPTELEGQVSIEEYFEQNT